MFNNYEQFVPIKLNESWAGRRLVEALSQLPPNHLANSLDAKFQQKQMQGREKRKVELTAQPKAETTLDSGPAARNMGNGKVRQMFDERRRGAGIDRSNPLKPIVTAPNNEAVLPSPGRKTNGLKSPMVGVRRQSAYNTSTSLAYDSKNSAAKDLNTVSKNLTRLSLREKSDKAQSYEDLVNNNNLTVKNTSNLMKRKTEIPLKPVVIKKAPTKTPTPRSVTNNNSVKASSMDSSRKSTAGSTTGSINTISSKASSTKVTLSIKPPPRIITPPPGMATCQFCSRNFNTDRLEKHEEVCKKMNTKKRKIFDATKQRVKGTEAEVYVKRSMRSGVASVKPMLTPKKSTWREKHESFIAAIRNAKKVQAHLAKGGKVSDLPPPPVSLNPDYIQCPHCSRRFNQGAAERHIPKCVNMRHNKPKPQARKN